MGNVVDEVVVEADEVEVVVEVEAVVGVEVDEAGSGIEVVGLVAYTYSRTPTAQPRIIPKCNQPPFYNRDGKPFSTLGDSRDSFVSMTRVIFDLILTMFMFLLLARV